MFDRVALSRLGTAIADVAHHRGDAPIILVSAKPEGEPYDLGDRLTALCGALGYVPRTVFLASWKEKDVFPTSGRGSELSCHRGPDSFMLLDMRTTDKGRFTGGHSMPMLLAAIDRINEAPMGRAPIIAILPDVGEDALTRTAVAIRRHMPGIVDTVTIQL